MPIRLLLVDDHPLVREGWRSLLGHDESMHVVGEADGGSSALALAHACTPDVVLMDIHMPGTDGIETTRLMKRHQPGLSILLATAYCTPPLVLRAIQAGANGCIGKDIEREDLVQAIMHAAQGYLWVATR